MKEAIDCLRTFDPKRECLNVIIETPKGSPVKYVYTPDPGIFRVKRVLPRGMVFPFNFGFIPETLGADGDPLDIVILNEEPVVSGCLVKARLLAVIQARQTEQGKTVTNDRMVGVAIDDEMPPGFFAIELDKRKVAQIEFFFATYNQLSGKQFKVYGVGGPRQAERLIHKGQKAFQQKHSTTRSPYDHLASRNSS